jgi:demethylspheroidene O-methyltransferase
MEAFSSYSSKRDHPLTWRMKWHRYRNKLLSNPAFQRWAARNPLTRSIGHRKALTLHHLTAGFVYSQTLSAIVNLELLDRLADGPVHTDEIAQGSALSIAAAETLLKAGGSLGLIEAYGNGLWGLGELGAAMQANPGIAEMVRHHEHLYQDLADPVRLLRHRDGSALSRYWQYDTVLAGQGNPQVYSQLMRESQAMIADHVLDAIDLSGCHLLVDIGGGTGAFAGRALDAFNTLKATVFDLPAVATAGAELNIDNPRLRFAGGDMFTGPLPLGADVVSFNRVLHDHDDDKVRKVLRNAYSALKPGGQIVIAEPMAETTGAEPIGHAYFGLYLWSLGSGRPRTLEELSRFLQEAGFHELAEQKTSMPCLVRVVTGIKPIS